MQSFSTEAHSFIPMNLNNYFCVYPPYWPNNIAFYSFNSPIGFQNAKEHASLEPLAAPMAPDCESRSQGQLQTDSPKAVEGKKIPKTKKLLSQGEEEQGDQEEFKIKLGKNSSSSSTAYKKKNTQSNIVNQTFSYLTSQRSKRLVSCYFNGDALKVEEFYRVMSKIKQASKKYINRKYLERLLAFERKSEFERAFQKAKISLLSIEDLRTAIRALLFNFLRGPINQTLLTSCKIYKETLPEHFWRRREILKFLFPQKGL